MVFAVVDVGLFDIKILRVEVFELPEPLPCNLDGGVFEINYFLNVGESSPEVEVVELIHIVLFEGHVVQHVISFADSKGFRRDGVSVLVLFGSHHYLVGERLFWHLERIIKEYVPIYQSVIIILHQFGRCIQ